MLCRPLHPATVSTIVIANLSMQSNPFRLILKYIRHPSDTMVYIVEDVHVFGIRGFNVGGMRLY
jgi:hypothetical protein